MKILNINEEYMRDWKSYQENTLNNKHNALLEYFNNIKLDNVVDLGCGSGNDTIYMLHKGCNVTAIDKEINEDFFFSRINKLEKARLQLIKADFENITIPKNDMVMAFFSIPFCKPDEFDKLWEKIYNSINEDGYFVGQLFGDRDGWREDSTVNTFNKTEVLQYLEKYCIVYFKEIEYIMEGDKKKWHFFDIIAQKSGIMERRVA